MNKFYAVILVGIFSACVHAACPTWPTAERFAFSGAEVTDLRTGLVWARCSVGQSWGGSTCNGDVTLFTHQAALTYAQTQTGWRIPNVKELSSLADKGCAVPALDSAAFPNTPSVGYWEPSSENYWTTSLYAGRPTNVWIVNFYQGAVLYWGRDSAGLVRLVRSGQ